MTRVGIERSGNFGRAIAVHLAIEWQPGRDTAVVEVPTLMTSRERRAQPGKGKTDPVDALAIARITARETQLPPVRLATGPAADLRAPLDYRDDLIAERTALVNRVHADLTDLSPGYQAQVTNLTTRTRVRAVLALLEPDRSVRADLCRRRLERVTAIDTEAAQLKRKIATLVEASGTTLTDEYGIGPLVAARFLPEVVDARRNPGPEHLRGQQRHRSPTRLLGTTGPASVRSPAATASSTVRCTQSRSPRSARPPRAAPTTTANEPEARPAAKQSAASNAGSPTSFTAPCALTPREPLKAPHQCTDHDPPSPVDRPRWRRLWRRRSVWVARPRAVG